MADLVAIPIFICISKAVIAAGVIPEIRCVLPNVRGVALYNVSTDKGPTSNTFS